MPRSPFKDNFKDDALPWHRPNTCSNRIEHIVLSCRDYEHVGYIATSTSNRGLANRIPTVRLVSKPSSHLSTFPLHCDEQHERNHAIHDAEGNENPIKRLAQRSERNEALVKTYPISRLYFPRLNPVAAFARSSMYK